ncbi:MAG: hypothetical protein ACRC7C_09870 [Beijerinckiaceae bacterium]
MWASRASYLAARLVFMVAVFATISKVAAQEPLLAPGLRDISASCLFEQGAPERRLRTAAVIDQEQQVLSSANTELLQAALESAVVVGGGRLIAWADSHVLLQFGRADIQGRPRSADPLLQARAQLDVVAIARQPRLVGDRIEAQVSLIATAGGCQQPRVTLKTLAATSADTTDLSRLAEEVARRILNLPGDRRPTELAVCPSSQRAGSGPSMPSQCGRDVQAKFLEALIRREASAEAGVRESISFLDPAGCDALQNGARLESSLRLSGDRIWLETRTLRGAIVLDTMSQREITGLVCDPRNMSGIRQLMSLSRNASDLNFRLRAEGALRVGAAFAANLEANVTAETHCWMLSNRNARGETSMTAYVLTNAENPPRLIPGEPIRFPQHGSLGSFDRSTPPDDPDLFHCFAMQRFPESVKQAWRDACGQGCAAGGAPKAMNAAEITSLARRMRAERDVFEAILWLNVTDSSAVDVRRSP